MHRSFRSSVVVAGALGLLGLTLAGCASAAHAAQSSTAASDGQSKSSLVSTQTNECAEPATLFKTLDADGVTHVTASGEPIDLGARGYAEGVVGLDADGHIVSYTVAAGDVEAVIRERLCFEVPLATMNHVRTLQPGQVLWLNPDPDAAWFEYHSPSDGPLDASSLPYQRAMEAMGQAVDAGDIDAARAIWAEDLRVLFFNEAEITKATAALDASDFEALRQMFS